MGSITVRRQSKSRFDRICNIQSHAHALLEVKYRKSLVKIKIPVCYTQIELRAISALSV